MWRHLSDSRRGKNIHLADLLRQSIYTAAWRGMRMSTTPSASPQIRPSDSSAQKDLRTGNSVDLPVTIVRDGTADRGRKPRRSGRAQSRVDCEGRSHRFTPTIGAGYGQHRGRGLWRPGGDRLHNGHFESTCHHPLLLFNRRMPLPGGEIAPGNVRSAESRDELLLPELKRP